MKRLIGLMVVMVGMVAAQPSIVGGGVGPTGPGYKASSTDSLATAGTGTKTFNLVAGLAYQAGSSRIRATSVGTGEYMEGVVLSYSGAVMVVTMDRNVGTGTHADWNISIVGDLAVQVYPGAGVAVSTGSAWDTSKAAPAGLLVGDSDTQTLTGKTLTAPSMTPQVNDCHTACSPTAALLSNAIVTNYGQGAANIAITGPTLATGMNFIMVVGTTQALNSWTYTSTLANVYLDAAGPYTSIAFVAPTVGNSISCFSFRIGASTYALRCVTLNGTSSGI